MTTDYNEVLRKKFESFDKMQEVKSAIRSNLKGVSDSDGSEAMYTMTNIYHMFGKATSIQNDEEEDALTIPAGSVVDLKNQKILYDPKKKRIIEFVPLMLTPIRFFKSKDRKLKCQSFDCKYPIMPSKANDYAIECDKCPRMLSSSKIGKCSIVGRPVGIPVAEHDDNFMFSMRFRSKFSGLHKLIFKRIENIISHEVSKGNTDFSDKHLSEFLVKMSVSPYMTDYGEQFSINLESVVALVLDADIVEKLDAIQNVLIQELNDYTSFRESRLEGNGYKNRKDEDDEEDYDDEVGDDSSIYY